MRGSLKKIVTVLFVVFYGEYAPCNCPSFFYFKLDLLLFASKTACSAIDT